MGLGRSWKRFKRLTLIEPVKKTVKKQTLLGEAKRSLEGPDVAELPGFEVDDTLLGMTDPAIMAARAEERERQRRRKGRRSTILTGPMGLLGGGPIQRPTLLGQ